MEELQFHFQHQNDDDYRAKDRNAFIMFQKYLRYLYEVKEQIHQS